MRAKQFIIMLVLSACASACSSTNSHDVVSTQSFITKVASSDQFEIASSKIVGAKSHDQNVKQLARQLIADHTKSSKEMKTILADNNMPSPPSGVTQDQQQMLDKLHAEKHFNGDYLDEQEKVHREAISLFENYQDNGDNEALRDFAAKTLPTLKKHYQMVEQAKELRAKNTNSVF